MTESARERVATMAMFGRGKSCFSTLAIDSEYSVADGSSGTAATPGNDVWPDADWPAGDYRR